MARDAGAPAGLLSAGLVVSGVAACILAWRRRDGWLDGWRLVLVLAGLWLLPGVYGGIGGDGYEYYALLRSPVLDGDLDFANDFAGLGARPVLSSEGEVTSRTPIGMAVLWLPGFLLAHLGALVFALLGGPPADGFSAVYRSTLTATSYALGFAALLLLEAVLRRRHGPALASLAILGLWLATPLHFYMVANPFMSHAGSAFAATGFVLAWLRARDVDSARAWALAGALGGLTALVRAQDAVLLVAPLLDVLLRPSQRLRRTAAYLAGPLALAAFQGAVWLALYGTRFVSVVTTQNWVGGGGVHALDVLLSPRHGLFSWTPLYLLAASGWLVSARREPRLAWLAGLSFALAVLINGAMLDWWGSEAFGQRRLLSLTPLFALGLGAALALLRARPLLPIAAGLALLIAWNLQFESIYNSGVVATRDQGVSLERLAEAQVDAAARRLMRWERVLPRRAFVLLYDNLRGIWLDEGTRRLGLVDLGAEPEDLPELVGHNWYRAEQQDGVSFRRSRGSRSWLRLPVRHPAAGRLVLRARSEMGELPVQLAVEVNGTPVGTAALAPEWSELVFDLPEAALAPGFNDVALLWSTSPRLAWPDRAGRDAAAAVDWLRYQGPPPVRAP